MPWENLISVKIVLKKEIKQHIPKQRCAGYKLRKERKKKVERQGLTGGSGKVEFNRIGYTHSENNILVHKVVSFFLF